MLTAKQISNAKRHDRATKQRPSGHFDHDAKCSVGPIQHRVSSTLNYEQLNEEPNHQVDADENNTSDSMVSLKMSMHIDTATGEQFYSFTTR